MSVILLSLAAAVGQPQVEVCDDRPVLLVVAGQTKDRARMLAYGKAIADSGLYQRLGGYYLSVAPPIETLEGRSPAGYNVVVVRFPCTANARAFWHSVKYQRDIVPLRLKPSAGDYIVTLHREVPLRADMVGKVGDARYGAKFDASGIEQLPR